MARATWFHPFTGQPRASADVAADPEGLACVDVMGPVRERAYATAHRETVLTRDRALIEASWAHLAHVGQYSDGVRFGVPWFYAWAVQRAFVAGAAWQATRKPPEESETCEPAL